MSDTTTSAVSTCTDDNVSINNLANHVQTLTDRIDELEQEVAKKDDRIDELESQQDQQFAIELRGVESPKDAEIEDIWIAGHPIGNMLQNAKNRDKIFRNALLLLAGWDRDVVEDNTGTDLPDGALDDCENAANGSTTSGTVTADPEQLVPIHRKTKARKTETHDLSGNKYRATFVWQAFHARAVKEQGKWKLSSAQVRNILDEHDLDTNRNTMRRTMKFVAKLSSEKPRAERDPHDQDNLITLATGGSKLTLVADQDEWEAYMSRVSEHLENKKRTQQDDRLDSIAAEDNALWDATPVTSTTDNTAGMSKDTTDTEGVTLS